MEGLPLPCVVSMSLGDNATASPISVCFVSRGAGLLALNGLLKAVRPAVALETETAHPGGSWELDSWSE